MLVKSNVRSKNNAIFYVIILSWSYMYLQHHHPPDRAEPWGSHGRHQPCAQGQGQPGRCREYHLKKKKTLKMLQNVLKLELNPHRSVWYPSIAILISVV